MITLRSIITVALNQSDLYGSDQTQASKNKGIFGSETRLSGLLNQYCGESQSFIVRVLMRSRIASEDEVKVELS